MSNLALFADLPLVAPKGERPENIAVQWLKKRLKTCGSPKPYSPDQTSLWEPQNYAASC